MKAETPRLRYAARGAIVSFVPVRTGWRFVDLWTRASSKGGHTCPVLDDPTVRRASDGLLGGADGHWNFPSEWTPDGRRVRTMYDSAPRKPREEVKKYFRV